MPSDDYTSTVRGSLKLKGSQPSGIEKKKKKKKSKPSTSTSTNQDTKRTALEAEDIETTSKLAIVKGTSNQNEQEEEEELSLEELKQPDPKGSDGKTASERAYEEMRRKRLNERLQKEGVKTHKQRVEELNKYLSNLSEHHDMPRIGPG